MNLPTVRVSRKGADRVGSGHPWIFASDVVDRGAAAPGDTVRVTDPRDRLLGLAHFSSTSQICLRLITDRDQPTDRAFYRCRIQEAQAYRRRVITATDAYRLVYSEADRLPGLIVDRYADCLALQALDQGMDRALPDILACLVDLFSPRAVVARNDSAVRERESLPIETRVVHGELGGPVSIHMNGLTLAADLVAGQKTGIYLDQRENYLAARRWARGRVLDCFTSTGGFALHMAPQCDSVEAVDSSAEAIGSARANAAANGIANIEFREDNAFDFLWAAVHGGRRYDTIVLDPPAFAKSRSNIEGAVRGYKEINLRALRLLTPGGILISCSCSHHVSEALLLETIASASLDAGRSLRVLERRTQALDHPVLLTVPETHYLKCLVLEVM